MFSLNRIRIAVADRAVRCATLKIVQDIPSCVVNGQGCVTVVPSRGMRDVKSVILHKEVIEKHNLEKENAAGDVAYPALQALKQQTTDNNDMPVDGLTNPYTKPPQNCILCELDIDLDYKNTRLLSQFVSSHTGQIYGRSVTGLCLYMQKRVAKLIKRSQYFGFMPYELKDPRFLQDPKLFDPFKRR